MLHLRRRSRKSPVVRQINLDRPAWRLVVWLAWPVLLQQYLAFAVVMSDSFLAGHFQTVPPEQVSEACGLRLQSLGTLGANPGIGGALTAEATWEGARQIMSRHVAAQAAQTTAGYMGWFTLSYITLVSVGSTALVARFIGANARRDANLVTNQSITLGVFLGVAGTVIALIGLRQLVNALQLRGDAAELAVAYLQPLFVVLTFQILQQAGIACLVGAGDTRTGFWVLGAVAIINLPLAWFFFHGGGPIPRFGFVGIALGTALSHAIGGIGVVVILAVGRAGLRLHLRLLKPDWSMLRRLLRISVPAAIDSMSGTLGQLWFLSLVNRLGDVASSAHGIAIRWEAIGYLSGNAFGTAAMTLIGQNLGAGRKDRAAHCGWVAFGLGCAFMCAMGLIFYTLATPMFALFCPDPEQKPVIDAGVPVLRLIAFAMPPVASYIIFTYALRGAGDTRVPVLFTWFGFLAIRIPLTYLLTQSTIDLGLLGTWPGFTSPLYGAWIAMTCDVFARGAFFVFRFGGGRWKEVRV